MLGSRLHGLAGIFKKNQRALGRVFFNLHFSGRRGKVSWTIMRTANGRKELDVRGVAKL